MPSYHLTPKKLTISEIYLDALLYPRKEISQARVDFFIELIKSGKFFPSVLVVWDEQRKCYIAIDGWHRIKARDALGHTEIDVFIIDLPQELWFSEAYRLASEGPMQLTPEEHKAGIKQMFNDGLDVEIIMERHGFSRGYIYKIIQPLMQAKREEQKQKVLKLREDELTYPEISKRTGLSEAQVYRICKANAESFKNTECSPSHDFPLSRKSWEDEGPKTEIPSFRENDNIACPREPDSAAPVYPDSTDEDYSPPDPDSEAGRVAIAEADKINKANAMLPPLDQDMTDHEVLVEFGRETPESETKEGAPASTDRKSQIKAQFPHQMIRFKSVKEWPEEGKDAARVLELIKFYKQDMDVIQEDTGKDPAFIKKVVIAAVKLMCTSGSNEDMFKVAEELKSPDLVPYIHGAILAANTCAPIAPHMPDWIKKNFSEQDTIALAYLLDVTRPNLFKILRGEKSQPADATNVVAEMPPKISEAYSVSQKLLREIRDTVRSCQYTSDVHGCILKENNKTLSITNEIYLCMKVKSDDGHKDVGSDLPN